MISALIFDIGNVLLRFDFSIAIRRLAPFCEVAPEQFSAQIEEVKVSYEAGQISRATFLREVFGLLKYRGSEAAFITAWEEIFQENQPMTALLPELSSRYPLFLLSNTSDIHVDYMLKAYPFFAQFRDAVYSYKVVAAKPGREIYEIALCQFGIKAEQTVFIDDLAANIATAQAIGLHAIQYDFRAHGQFEERLREVGVLGRVDSMKKDVGE